MKKVVKFSKKYFLGEGSNYDGYPYPLDFIEKTILLPRLKKIEPYLTKFEDKNILDIGCSNGCFLHLSDQFQLHTFGLDISRYALKLARKITNATLICADAEQNLPFSSNSFAVVVAFDTIEHLSDPIYFSREVYRILKKGGVFFMITPNGKQSTDQDQTHLSLFKLGAWENILRETGFRILESYTYCEYSPTPYLLIQRCLNFWHRLTGKYLEQAALIAVKP